MLTNYPEGQVEELDASYYPHDVPLTGSRKVPFSRELWIEREDFMEDPPEEVLPSRAGTRSAPALRRTSSRVRRW